MNDAARTFAMCVLAVAIALMAIYAADHLLELLKP